MFHLQFACDISPTPQKNHQINQSLLEQICYLDFPKILGANTFLWLPQLPKFVPAYFLSKSGNSQLYYGTGYNKGKVCRKKVQTGIFQDIG